MLIDAHRSLLLVLDVQEKLLPAIHDHQRVIANVAWLIRAARKFDIPVPRVIDQHTGSAAKSRLTLPPGDCPCAVLPHLEFSGLFLHSEDTGGQLTWQQEDIGLTGSAHSPSSWG